MTGNQQWVLVFFEDNDAHSTHWTRDPPDDTLCLRGLSVQIKR